MHDDTLTSPGGDCAVWLATPADDTSHLVVELDEIERGRRRQYRQVADCNRFTVGAVLLRRAVADHLDIADPGEITIDRTCPDCGRPHGRPRVERHSVEVSVAHSGSWVAVALCERGPVGVDVERIPDRYDDVLDIACAPDERSLIRDARDFARIWARKESVLKAMGTGLRRPPADIVVSAATEPPELRWLVDGDRATTPPCAMRDIDPDGDHAGAVAVLTDGEVAITVEDGSVLLAR